MMLGVVTLANTKTPHVEQPRSTASVAVVVGTVLPAHATPGDFNPRVTLSYSTLDVTALTASAYGDVEF